MRRPPPAGDSTRHVFEESTPTGTGLGGDLVVGEVDCAPDIGITADLSIVVPCRNERDSVGALLRTMRNDLYGRAIEVVFVDDSDDGTVDAIERAAREFAFPPVRTIHRTVDERTGGLGSAVVTGTHVATASHIAVMDADLQHPPTALIAMYEYAALTGIDVVVGSRYVCGGNAPGLSRGRRIGSRVAGRLARTLFPRRLAGVRDPMSGLFVYRVDAVDMAHLAPDGFKILLEVLVRTRDLTVAEIPYTFDARQAGTSKATAREAWRYLRALLRLRFSRQGPPRNRSRIEIVTTEVVSR